MKPKQSIIDRAVENGSMDKVNRLLSAAHLLNGEINLLVSEAEEELQRNGLRMGTLKQNANRMQHAMDIYFADFQTLIPKGDKAYLQDLGDFDKAFRKWSKILDVPERDYINNGDMES